jgi:spore coat protein U-like protein
MNYSLYTTSARTTVWTATAASGAVGSGTTDASGTPISLTVFGRLFPQTVATGSYQDTITVSVSY